MRIPIDLHVSGRVDIHHHVSVTVRVESPSSNQPGLIGPIGPFGDQELPPMPNPSVNLKDNQYFDYGPFNAVDARGQVIGPATGVVPSTGDATLLAGDTAAAAGELPLADGALRFRAVGALGTVQAVATDSNGKTGTVDVTIGAGAEAGIVGSVGAPADLPS